MRINIIETLQKIGVNEPFYWGKRVVKSLIQPGSFKSHSVVLHWNEPHRFRLDVRAGASGRQLAAKELAQYPLQFQTETFFEFDVNDDEKSTDQKGRSGKGSGGAGVSPKKNLTAQLQGVFALSQNQDIATHATLTRGVVMGMEIGQKALAGVFDLLCEQIRAAKVLATDLLAQAGKAVTRYTPPPFMAPRGDEDKVYKYDRTKNETMFGVVPS